MSARARAYVPCTVGRFLTGSAALVGGALLRGAAAAPARFGTGGCRRPPGGRRSIDERVGSRQPAALDFDASPSGKRQRGRLPDGAATPKTCGEAAMYKTYVGCDFWPTIVANGVSWSGLRLLQSFVAQRRDDSQPT